MTKFTEKSVSHFPLAYYFSAMQAFDTRIGAVVSSLERLIQLRAQQHQLFTNFDSAYQQSRKSMSTKNVSELDKIRDNYGYVMEHVAALWAEKLDDDDLNIHGRRVQQVFKDYNFRITEALVAENAKVDNMQQRFAEPTLAADLAAMGLTELNQRFAAKTAEIKQVMQQRNEENSALATGLVKQAREALEQGYRQMITYLNAVQELQPEESISQAAQFYNEDYRKIEQQLAQSRKGGSVSPGQGGGTGSDTGEPSDPSNPTTPDNPSDPTNPTNPTNPINPDNPGGGGTGGGGNSGGSGGGDDGGDEPFDSGN